MNIRQKERIFFFTHAMIILSLFTYSVCDEKVKKLKKFIWTLNNQRIHLKRKKNTLPGYLFDNYFVCQFFNNFPDPLLCVINVLDILNMVGFFLDFCHIAKY